MSDQLLTILKFVFLALVWLFFLRVLRAVWAEISRPAPARALVAPSATPVPPPPPPRRRGTAASGTLRVLAPPAAKGAMFEIGHEATVGRGKDCTISLDDRTVSTLHARFFRNGGRLVVEDLGSTNGTYLNGKKIGGEVSLQRGDRVTVGETVLEVTK